MGQSFYWWNYDQRVCRGGSGKLGEWLIDGRTPRVLAWFLLRHVAEVRPLPPVEQADLPKFVSNAALAARSENKRAIISHLPVETVDQIFKELRDLADILSFSVTSRRCWDIGRNRVRTVLERKLNWPSWAGDRIMCLGEYFEFPEHRLPEGMLSANEQEIFDGHIPQEEFEDYYFSSPRKPLCWTKYGNKYTSRLSEEEGALMHRLITVWPHPGEYFHHVDQHNLPPLQTQVLRNLTRREYVRGETLYKFTHESAEKLGVRELSFGEVVTARICWSPDGSVSMSYEGGIHRGVWAGHRFDIQRVDDFDPNAGGEAWKDVSDEVIENIRAIWKAEFGSDSDPNGGDSGDEGSQEST